LEVVLLILAPPSSGFHLETERLVLRDWREEDWPEFFRLTNTPAVMRWLGGVTDAEAQKKARQRHSARRAAHGHDLWAVERLADGGDLSGELLGFCGIKLSDQEGGPLGEFEIGWRLREDAWGSGYAREAAEASLRAAFERLGASQVIALTVEENVASWGLMRRLGMRRRDDLDFYSTGFVAAGEYVIVYSISHEEWARP
jgi:RimJ/RimL family protein N-acetyltransferase